MPSQSKPAKRAASKPTINDIARLSGVSKKTVSRVINRADSINPQTRAKVEAMIAETGYVPNPQARALALGRNFLIGLIHDNPNAQMILNMQQGILEGLRDTEFEMLVRPVDRTSPALFEDVERFISRQRLFGVVILPPLSENDQLAKLVESLGCRYVRMGSAELDDPQHIVASNDRDAVREAVQYLIEQGHRRIGHITGPNGFRSAIERQKGYEEALARAGIKVPQSMVVAGEYTFDSGVRATEKLLDMSPPPTAIFAANDEMAAGVLFAARLRGLQVPGQLSIIGFDDTPIASRVWPPLTTVRWPIVAMGRSAALKLIASEAGRADAAEEPWRFVSTLIRRGSVTSPSA